METASERITHKLRVGTLPTDEPGKVWGGYGSGLECDGCDVAITSKEPEHELQMQNGRVLHFHVACAGLWRILRQALLLDRKHAPPPFEHLVIPDLPENALRRKIRVRLAARQLFLADGISAIRRGTGRPCIVCELPIYPPTLEREVEGPGVVGLAHPACYVIWREESMARQRKAG